MSPEEPYCLIRNLDDPHQPSPSMRFSLAIARAKLGDWGSHWQIEEAFLLDEAAPQALRIIGRHTEAEGFCLIEQDPVFEAYCQSIRRPVPDSVVMPLLKAAFAAGKP